MPHLTKLKKYRNSWYQFYCDCPYCSIGDHEICDCGEVRDIKPKKKKND